MSRWHRVAVYPVVALSASALSLAGGATPSSPAFAATPGPSPGAPASLTVDGLTRPLGLATTDVQFGWHVSDSRRGAGQSAYRIVVSRPVLAGAQVGGAAPVWDSGKVVSADQAFVPYAGPPLSPDTSYRWTVQTWDLSGSAGPFAQGRTFDTGLGDGDWRAEWIRRTPADPNDAADEYTYARKEQSLGRSPIVRARAYVSGDQQYELYVNGTRAGKGEAFSYPDSQYYETLDVTRLLRPGSDNAVGLLYNWEGATKGRPAGAPGVIAQISVLHADGSTELISTDGSWRVRRGAWLPGTQRDQEGDQVGYTENINGPDYPVGWEQPGFDDSRWAPAAVVGRPPAPPWIHLVSVRTRIVEQPVKALSLTRLATGAVVADFGKVYAAVPTVTFHHGVRGHVVTMHAGYLLDRRQPGKYLAGVPGQVSTLHGTQHTDMSYSYVQRGGVETFHPFDYLGFRYLQIDDPGENLAPGDVVALVRHAAVPNERAGTFSSSDPAVDAAFELGRHSALYTAQEQFVDTPTREKGPWLWDGFNESQTAMDAFGEQNLTRKSLLEFAQSQARYWPNGAVNKIYPTGLGAEDIAEFTEIYPEWVWQYWMHTGDRSVLSSVYPVLLNLAGYVSGAIDPATGLVTNLAATDGTSPLPVVTRQNVLGVNVLRRAADAALALGMPTDQVARLRQAQAALTAAINARLTRPDGTYVDGLGPGGAQSTHASQDSNTVALAYGIVPAPRESTVASYVASLGMSSEPQTAGELLEALALGGRDNAVVRRITDARSNGWANILARGATFTWEVWQPSDGNGDSMSHGWGSNVLVEIQQVLLGVRPTSPGYATFGVKPPAGGLARASGRVPTPRGDIQLSWSRPSRASGRFSLDLTVPTNSVATVHLPTTTKSRITEGGRSLRDTSGVRLTSTGDGGAVLQVSAGTYHLASSPVPRSSIAPSTPDAPGGIPSWAAAVIAVAAAAVLALALLVLLFVRRRRAEAPAP